MSRAAISCWTAPRPSGQHLDLARGQAVRQLPPAASACPRDRADDVPLHGRVERRLAARHGADAARISLRAGVLGQVAAGAGPQRLSTDVVGVVVRAMTVTSGALGQPAGGLDAVDRASAGP